MSTTEENPRREAAFFTTIRSWGITRGEHGFFGGVVEGVGNRIGMDRVPARLIALVLLFVTGGMFLAVYAAAWALLPDRAGRIIIQDFGRGTPNIGALLMIGLFALIGGNSGPGLWFRHSNGGFPFGIAWGFLAFGVIVGVIALVVVAVGRSGPRPRSSDSVYAVPPPSTRRDGDAATAPKAAAASATSAAPGASPAVPPSSEATLPPRPRTPGPGSGVYLLVLSTLVLAAAAVWWLDRDGRIAVAPVTAWFAAAVVIIGGAIVLVGALGRRVGFLGFLATTLIIGWVIGLAIVPRALDLVDNGVTFTVNGVTHTVGAGHGWYDASAPGVTCGGFSSTTTDATDAPTVEVSPAQSDVTISSNEAVLVVPRDASLRFESDQAVTGSLSIESRGVRCDLEEATGRFYSNLTTGEIITIHLATDEAAIIVEER